MLFTHYYLPEYGAPQRRWASLIAEFRRAGHEVTVVAPPPHYPSGTVPPHLRAGTHVHSTREGRYGEQVVRCAYLPHRSDIYSRTADHAVAAFDSALLALWMFGIRRRTARPDVVVATAPGIPSLLAGLVTARLLGVPFVAEMRDAWPDLVTHVSAEPVRLPRAASAARVEALGRPTGAGPDRRNRATLELSFPSAQDGPPPERLIGRGYGLAGTSRTVRGRRAVTVRIKRLVHRQISALQKRADAVVTTTVGFADILQDRGVKQVRVLRNMPRTGPRMDLPEPPLEAPALRVLYFGNIGRSQGLDAVVRGAAIAKARGALLDVRFVGHGFDHSRLERLAAELDAPVTVLSRVPQEQASAHYVWADTVLVSLQNWAPFEWTIPSKTYELLATGRHITAVVAGETARIIEEAGAGDVVPPGDAQAIADHFESLAAHRDRLRRESRGAEWLAEHANIETIAADYLELLGSVVRR
nr:glycosyltransferase family 4 protein [Helcobacillus sp. ACRRO]